jgi:hypothetical protein
VILYHASAWGFIAMFFWTDRYRPVTVPNFDMLGGATYFSLRAIEQLIIYGIPTFMFVSGFFIAISTGRSQKAVPWRLVYERIKNLAIPFVLWSLIILGLNLPREHDIRQANWCAPSHWGKQLMPIISYQC